MWFPFRSFGNRPRPQPGRTKAAFVRLTLEALEGRALPSFLPTVSIPVGAPTENLTAGDFTNDTIPDLLATERTNDRVTVLPGNGDGTFGAARSSAAGADPLDLAVGDFNRDGKLDLVTAHHSTHDVKVQLGNGDGTFQPPRSFGLPKVGSATQNARGVSVGDFNNDGKLDLAVVASGPVQLGGTHRFFGGFSVPVYIDVLLGRGDGTFRVTSTTSVGNSPGQPSGSALAPGDVNGDGRLDVLVNCGTLGVFLLTGRGDGRLSAPVLTPIPFATNMTVTDLNGDGMLDVITASASSGAVRTYLGNGAGSFQLVQSIAPGPSVGSIVVGDFDRDGRPDVAAVASDTAFLLLGNGDGSLQPAQAFPISPTSAFLTAGDFNRDGWLDLAGGDSTGISLLLNDRNW